MEIPPEEKMGRRKKEPEHVHREAIASAAEDLFVHKGIQAATMDDIAKNPATARQPCMCILQTRRKSWDILP